MTEFGTPSGTRRRNTRRSALPPIDPRRAPGSVAEPPSRAPESILPVAAAPPDATALHAAATGVALGVATIRAAWRSMPPSPAVSHLLHRRGDARHLSSGPSPN